MQRTTTLPKENPHQRVCALVPTLNESTTIESVVTGLIESGFDDVLVIDGGSTDGTRDRAAKAGARVVEQTGTGKGQAVREALTDHIGADVVVMLDGDGTYVPSQADRVLEPIFDGEADHVIGNRFADMEDGAMPRLNRVGNRLINSLFAAVHGADYTDILSGYRAFTVDAWERMHMGQYEESLWGASNGFGLESEMAAEANRQGLDTEVVPISYRARPDGSTSNLNPIRDGVAIVDIILRMGKLNRPLMLFGAVALASVLGGVATGGYVAIEWATTGTSHTVLAIFSAFLILLGTQLLLFGVLADLIVRLHGEQRARIDSLNQE